MQEQHRMEAVKISVEGEQQIARQRQDSSGIMVRMQKVASTLAAAA